MINSENIYLVHSAKAMGREIEIEPKPASPHDNTNNQISLAKNCCQTTSQHLLWENLAPFSTSTD
jgi:hypothetical protein